MDKIVFAVSDNVSLCIPLLVPEKVLHLYSLGSIILAREGDEDVTLYEEGSFFCAFDNLQYRLVEALEGKLEAQPEDVRRGLGYLYNEYLGNMMKNKLICGKQWDRLRHELWSRGKGYAFTQIYTCAGKIFLEMSPYYPWHCYYVPRADDGYVPYDEYMVNYKPIAVLELSREVAEEWLGKSRELLKIMSLNSEEIEHAPN